ncbi:phage portal protein [Clostridium botulinum]|nr:phage portal protein [Clostridium botulinum]NFP31024.1 phage portal protein [Clostridium botulinum]
MIFDKLEKRSTLLNMKNYTWNGINSITLSDTEMLKEQTYMKCIHYISNKMASMPIKIKKCNEYGEIEEKKHPLYSVLRYKPNNYQNSIDLIKSLYIIATHEGIGGLYIDRKTNTLHLCKINQFIYDDMNLFQSNRNHPLLIEITIGNERIIRFEDDVILARNGISYDGIQVKSIKHYLHDDVKNIKSGSDFLNTLFKNGMMNNKIAVTLTSDIKDEKELKRMADRFTRMYDTDGRIFTLPAGMGLQNLSNSLVDSEFSVLRKMSKQGIANAFGLYPSMVGLTDKSPSEEEKLNFLTDTLLPLIMSLEVEMYNKLLTIEEKRSGYIIKLDTNVLLRTTPKIQQEIVCEYAKQGIYSLNTAKKILGVPLLEKDVTVFPSGQITLEALMSGKASWQKNSIEGGDEDGEGNNSIK